MTTVLLCVLCLMVGLALGLFLAGRAEWPASDPSPIPEPVSPPPAPAPAPVPVAPVATAPRPAAGTVRVRLMSGSGRRLLAELTIPARDRRQHLEWRGKDGLLGQFIASNVQDGVWIYRRVGVRRESVNG